MNAPSLRGLSAAVAIAVTVVSSLPSSVAAQTGLYAPLVLLLPSGPRTLALGNTGVASRDDDVIFFNPAQLVNARGVSASGERYSAPNAGGGSLSAATAFASGGIAIGARAVDYEVPTNFFPADRSRMLDAGVPASSYELSVGIGQTYKGFRGGIAGKYAEDMASTTRVGRAMVDVGLAKDFFRNYTVGLAVQNIGSEMSVPCTLTNRAAHHCIVPSGFNGFTTETGTRCRHRSERRWARRRPGRSANSISSARQPCRC